MAAERTQQDKHIVSHPSKLLKGDPSCSLCGPLQQGDHSDRVFQSLVWLHLCKTHGVRETRKLLYSQGRLKGWPYIKIPGRILTYSIQSAAVFPTSCLPRAVKAIAMTSSKMPLQASHTNQTEWSSSSPFAKLSAIYKHNEFLTKYIVSWGSTMTEGLSTSLELQVRKQRL